MLIDITLKITSEMIENAKCNLKTVLESSENFNTYTFPMNYAEMSGLPCMVVVEI